MRDWPRWETITKTNPKMAAINISLEPNSGATWAMTEVINIKQITEKIPPKNEDQ